MGGAGSQQAAPEARALAVDPHEDGDAPSVRVEAVALEAQEPGLEAVHPHGHQPERLGLPVALQQQQEGEGGADQRVPARVPDQPGRHAVHAPCEFRGPAVVLAGLHQRREVLVGENILDLGATPVAAVGGARIGSLAGDVAVSEPSRSRQDLVGRSAAVAAARGSGRRAGQADWIAVIRASDFPALGSSQG